MTDIRSTTTLTSTRMAIVLAILLVGCAQKNSPTRTDSRPGGPGAEASRADDPQARLSALRSRAAELAEVSQRMPGRNPAEDRQLTADAFDKATESLELLGGPSPDGGFRQQLRIIDNTRTFLRSAPASVSTDSSVDSGLRSLHSGLNSVRERAFPTDAKVRGQLEALWARVGELDSVRGPLHSLVVAQSFDAASKAIDTIAQAIEGRAGGASASTGAAQ